MAKTLPPLARTVAVGSTYYAAGSIPPLAHARKITNKKNWEGGVVPDFENGGYEDGPETEDSAVHNSSAVNAGRTGLPGFGPGNPAGESSGAGAGGVSQNATPEQTGEGQGDGGTGGEGSGDGGDQGDGEGNPPAPGSSPSPTGDEVPAPGTGTAAAKKRTTTKAPSSPS